MGKKYLKIVLDANIVVSFFIHHGAIIDALFLGFVKRAFHIYLSEDIVREIQRVFLYPKIAKILTVPSEEITMLLTQHAEWIEPKQQFSLSRDPTDAKYLEAASACQADYLVSGDRDLLSLKKFGITQIVSPKEFVEILQKGI